MLPTSPNERSFADMKKWNPLIHKTFYERNPKNEKEIRTYYMSFNPFASKIVPQISNWVQMEPTQEMEPLPPNLLQSIMTMQPNTPEFF